jgi:hypothetical protein
MGRAFMAIERAVRPAQPVHPDFSATPALNVRPILSQMILLARRLDRGLRVRQSMV